MFTCVPSGKVKLIPDIESVASAKLSAPSAVPAGTSNRWCRKMEAAVHISHGFETHVSASSFPSR